PLRVTVNVSAENFVIDGPPWAEIDVPPAGDSHPVLFRLRGEAAGPGRIMIDFAQDGRPLGSVDLTPEVVADAEPPGRAARPARGGQPPGRPRAGAGRRHHRPRVPLPRRAGALHRPAALFAVLEQPGPARPAAGGPRRPRRGRPAHGRPDLGAAAARDP